MGVHSLAHTGLRRAVFLDRDGVINRAWVKEGKPYPPPSAAQLEILPDVAEALAKLHSAGFLLIVATNQPDVARGRQSRAEVEAIHAKMSHLPIDSFRVCYHDDQDQCDCRKPAPGLLVAAAQEFSIDLSQSYMIGDRWRDTEAGRRAGCTTLFIDYGYLEQERSQPHHRVKSLLEAATWILDQTDSNRFKRVQKDTE